MDVVSLFWNPIWPQRRHVNLLHSTLFVSAETRNKGKGVPRVSVRVSPGSPRIPGTRLRSFANAKVHRVSLAGSRSGFLWMSRNAPLRDIQKNGCEGH